MKLKWFEKLFLSLLIIGGVTTLTYFGSLTKTAYGIGETDLGQMVTSIGSITYTGYQVLTPNSTTASTLTVPSNVDVALITVETANVRCWWNGTAPTTSNGHLIGPTGAGATIWIVKRANLLNFKVISVSTHGKLMIQYGR